MNKLLTFLCTLSLLSGSFFSPEQSPAATEEENTKIVTLKEFPLRRLNYMYSNYVVPVIFDNNGGAFVTGVMGEFFPPAPEEYAFGVRTIQGYGAKSGMTISLVFDAYKSYSFEYPARFEINSGFGLGYNSEYFGIHMGVFGQFAIKDFKADSENDMLGPAGPVYANNNGEKNAGVRGDWYGYYKIFNFVFLKTIFNDYSSDLFKKENVGLIGISIADLVGVDYFRNIGSIIGDLRLSSFTLRKYAGYKSDDLDFNFDIRGGYNQDTGKFSEYAFAADVLLFQTVSAGIEYNKSDFTDNHFGFTAGYIFFMTIDDSQTTYMKLFYYKSYSPYVLQYNADQGLLVEWRMTFGGNY